MRTPREEGHAVDSAVTAAAVGAAGDLIAAVAARADASALLEAAARLRVAVGALYEAAFLADFLTRRRQ